jgi:hypothetical protein
MNVEGYYGTFIVISEKFALYEYLWGVRRAELISGVCRTHLGLKTYQLLLKIIIILISVYTGLPPYLRVIRSKTYRGYVKPWIIPKAIYSVIFV